MCIRGSCQAIVSGADAVNLVTAALPAKDLSELYRMASGLGLDVIDGGPYPEGA